MEQRTFFAIILSFVFLMAYNALVISPKQKNIQLSNSINVSATSKDMKVSLPAENVEFKNSENITEKEKSIEIGEFKIFFGEKSGIIKTIYNKSLSYSSVLTNFLYLYPDQNLKSYSITSNEAIFLYQYNDVFWKQELKAIENNKLTSRIIFSSPLDSEKAVVDIGIFNIDAKHIIRNVEIMRDSMLFEYSQLVAGKVKRRGHAYKFTEKDNHKELQMAEWFAWRDRYHFTLVRPLFKCPEFTTTVENENNLNVKINNCHVEEQKPFEFEIFVGPQDLELLNSFGGNIHNVMAFSGNPILNWIEKAIYKFILFLNKFTNNWGLSIILISFIIYGITYPLTFKSMMSMRKMQELQPKMTELREKYKDDPQKLNAEVIQLYKINNVNPLSGCLPTLLQMPVFISLYQVLWRTHNFQHANFLWIKDLSMPDRAFIMNMNFPFIGNEINILPLFMSIVMFFQQRFSSKNVIITDPTQEMQQKMMMWIFPIFIGGIFYHFASGLTLYFTIFYLMSTLMQYKMSKLRTAKI